MKILIVDDEPLVRKSLGRACLLRRHEVIEAADGATGLVKWLENSPQIVFLDVLMPGLSGPEVLKEIVARTGRRPDALVVLMSAYSGEHNVETAHQSGADLFIPKPFEDVFALVERAEELEKDRGRGA